jgi:hypothetical protein
VSKLANKQLPLDLLAREDLSIRENKKKREINTSTAPQKNTKNSVRWEKSRSSDTNLGWAAEVPLGVESRDRRRRGRQRQAVVQLVRRQYTSERRENGEARAWRRRKPEWSKALPAKLHRRGVT